MRSLTIAADGSVTYVGYTTGEMLRLSQTPMFREALREARDQARDQANRAGEQFTPGG